MTTASCRVCAGALGLALMAGSAQAAYFSFASDNDHTSWTFRGQAGNGSNAPLLDGSDSSDSLNLLIDDGNGPLGNLSISVDFNADLALTHAGSFNVGPFWQHVYTVAGAFSFADPSTGAAWLVCSINSQNPGSFTAPGTANTWSTAGAVLGSDGFADITWTVTAAFLAAHPEIAAYGLVPGSTVGPDDFGFDLTVINVGEEGVNVGPNVALGQDKLPTAAWRAEASFSGSSGAFVPAPGAAALLGLGGLVMGRRRRA